MRTQRVHPTDNKGIKKKASDKIVAVKLKIHFAVVFRRSQTGTFYRENTGGTPSHKESQRVF